MHDPFPACPEFLAKAVTPISNRLNLSTFPLHVHEALFAAFFYHALAAYVSPVISPMLFPKTYNSFNKRTKVNWDIHVVSLFQSVFICIWSIYVMTVDEERKNGDKVFGYTGLGGTVVAFGWGYFAWDLMISMRYVSIFGPGLLAHAVSALIVYSLGFRPFVNYYAPIFLLYELSSPMLNIHWFLDKLNYTGGTLQLLNGLLLLGTFFGCRLVFGNLNSIAVFKDIFHSYSNPPPHIKEQGMEAPLWLAMAYLGSNTILNTLNVFWFWKMIATLRKRFEKPALDKRSKGAIGTTDKKTDETLDENSILELIKEKGVAVKNGEDGEDDSLVVEGTSISVPPEIIEGLRNRTNSFSEMMEKQKESLRQRKNSLTGSR